MKNLLYSVYQRVRGTQPKPPPTQQMPTHGIEGIKHMGHRNYVGGLWDQLGQLQFDFLVSNGLKPQHYLLDIACGSLRGGVLFVPYLDVGHYLGIDKEEDLIRAGIEQELGRELYEQRKPQLIVSSSFEFEKFTAQPDYSLAQSLFTHLPAPIINDCFMKLRKVAHSNSQFYATFFETEKPVTNPTVPHDQHTFAYTRQEMEQFGTQHGWSFEYIGNWNHPRKQIITRYRPA